jgi:tRNA pseudouridine13 synthase
LYSGGLKTGAVPFYAGLSDDLREKLGAVQLQLPSARVAESDQPTRRLLQECLADEGLDLRELRVRDVRDCFFSRARRRAIVVPENLEAEWGRDESEPDRTTLTLRLVLPAGSYATIVVKRLTLAASDAGV